MKRIWIAGLLCAGAVIPVAIMSTFLLGCCVLPFHRVLHRYFPICGGIVKWIAPGGHHDATPARTVTKKHLTASTVPSRTENISFAANSALRAAGASRLRNQIAHGALRCDDDVGLLILLSVMLI